MPSEIHFWGLSIGAAAIAVGFIAWKMKGQHILLRLVRGILFLVCVFLSLLSAMQWLSWYK